MPVYKVNIPGRGTFDVQSRRELTDDEAIAAVMAELEPPAPSAPEATPESGFTPAIKAGFSGLKSGLAAVAGRTGLMDEDAAAQYIAEQEDYQRRTFKPTETWGEAPFTKFTELLGGSLPYVAAPVAAAGAVAAAPLTGTAATLAGLGAAGVASATQFTGSNLLRQMNEGVPLSQTDLPAALAAAGPQAALDVLSFKLMPGIRAIFSAAGKDITEQAAAQIAKQTTGQIAKDYAQSTGTAMGVEGLTESGQQLLERLQAGLNIADADARDEYFESFIGGAVLGGTLAPAGRYFERGAQQRKEEKAEQERLAAERRAAAEEEQSRETAAGANMPLFTAEEALTGDVAGAFTEYDAQQVQADKETVAEEVQAEYTSLYQQIERLQNESAEAAQRGDAAAAGDAARRLEVLENAAKSLEKRTKTKDDALFGVTLKKPPVFRGDVSPRKEGESEESFKQRIQEANDLEADIYERIGKAKAKLDKAGALGDFQKINKASAELQTLKDELAAMKQQPDLFGTRNMSRIEKAEAEIAKAEAEAAAAEEKKQQTLAEELQKTVREQRAQRRKTQEEQEIENRQMTAARRLEFGLNRLDLKLFDIDPKATKRLKAAKEELQEATSTGQNEKRAQLSTEIKTLNKDLGKKRDELRRNIDKGIITPDVARILGLSEVTEPTRAVDVLPEIETIYEKALGMQKQLTSDMLSGQADLFDAQGRLTKAGNAAMLNEAWLKNLGKLRSEGRAARETLDREAAERDEMREVGKDIEGFEPLASIQRMRKGVSGLTDKTRAQELREEVDGYEAQLKTLDTALASPDFNEEQKETFGLQRRILLGKLQTAERRLEKEFPEIEVGDKGPQALDPDNQMRLFTSAVYDLQRGQFLGQRPTIDKSPRKEGESEEAFNKRMEIAKNEEEYNKRLQAKVNGVQRQIDEVKENLKKANTPNQRTQLNSRLGELQGKLKTLEAGLTQQPQKGKATFKMVMDQAKRAADGFVRGTLNKIEGARAGQGKPQLTQQERSKLETQMRNKLNEFIQRASAARRVPTTEEVAPAQVRGTEIVGAAKTVKTLKETERPFTQIREALEVLKADLKDLSDKAIGAEPEAAAPVETGKAPALGRVIRGNSAIEMVANQIKEIDEALEKATRPDTAYTPKMLQEILDRLAHRKVMFQSIEDFGPTFPMYEQFVPKGWKTKINNDMRFYRVMLETQVGREKTIKALESAKAAAEATIRNIHAKVRKKAGPAPETVQREEIRKIETELFNILKPAAQFEQTQFLMQSGAKLKTLKNLRAELKSAIAKGERQTTKTADTRAMLKEAKAGLKTVEKQIADLEEAVANMKTRRVEAKKLAQQYADALNAFSKTALTEAERKRYERLSIEQRAELVLQKMEEAEPEVKAPTAASEQQQYLDLLQKAKDKAEALDNTVRATQKKINSLRATKKGKTPKQIEAIDADLKKELTRLNAQKTEAARASREVGTLLKKGSDQAPVTPEARYSIGDIALAKLALDNRITAVLKGLEAMPPKTRTVDDIMRDIQLGTIKTPTGQALPETRVVTEYQKQEQPRPAKIVEAERKAAEAIYGPLEEKARAEYEQIKDDPNVSKEEKQNKILEIARAARLRKVPDVEIIDVPIRKVVRVSIDPETQAEIAQEEMMRARAPRVKEKPKTALQEAEDAVAEAQDLFTQAEKELVQANATGNRAVITAAKAKYLNAQKGLSAIYAAKVKAEQKLERKIKPAKSDRGAVATLELDESIEAEPIGKLIEEINKDIDIAWRVGDERNDVIDMDAAVERLKEVKARTDKMGIKFVFYKQFTDLPDDVIAQQNKQGMKGFAHRITGGVMPDGTVFAIAGNHNSVLDLEKTIAHELTGHYSFDFLLGKDGLTDLMRKVDKAMATEANENGLEVLAKKLGLKKQYFDALTQTYNFYKPQLAEGKITEREVRNRAKVKGMRELIAYTMERRVDETMLQKAQRWLQELVGAFRAALKKLGLINAGSMTTSDLFKLMKEAERNFTAGKAMPYTNVDESISLRTVTPRWGGGVDQTVRDAVSDIVAPGDRLWDKVKANVQGLNFRTQFLDRIDSLEKIKRKALEKGLLDAVKAVDLTYFVRMFDQTMSFVAEAATNGVVQLRKVKRPDGQEEYELSRDLQKDAASLKKVALALADAGYGDAQANGNFFTAYMAAERALAVGPDKAGSKTTAARYDALRREGRNNPAIQEARRIYNEYNADLVTLMEQSGYLSKEKAAELKAKRDYVPYYIPDAKGIVHLMVDGERITRVGSLVEQPELKALVGSDMKIRNFFDTSLQNTNMVMSMALRNLGTRNVGFVLQSLGLAQRVNDTMKGPTTIHARIDGKDVAWKITTAGNDVFGDIPAETIVHGMNGIKLQLPGAMQIFSVPANIFRKFITRDPAYAIRQVFRDSTAAYMAGGSDAKPVLGALKELGTMITKGSEEQRELSARGLGGGQVVTGAPEDMSKILQQITAGKPGWELLMTKLDGLAMAGDMATRVAAYKSFIKQGLSNREAGLAALEIMNFSRRGTSPSVTYANAMIPFLAANIQGIDVLYRAFKGEMGSEKQLEIQKKLVKRGLFMAGATALYAVAMSDEEPYKNATADQRYSNWLIPLPFVEGALRVPIPFELGFIFKALPEALVRAINSDDKGGEIVNDMRKMLMKSLPGDIPLTLKPAIEVMANYSFFMDRPILSQRLAGLDVGLQVGEKTPQLVAMASSLGISPVKLEYLIRGYSGSLGLGIVGMFDYVIPGTTAGTEAVAPELRAQDIPVFGRMIQPKDAGGLTSKAFQVVDDAEMARNTFNELLRQGRGQEAREYFKDNLETIGMASPAGQFRNYMGQLAKLQRAIKANPNMSAERKRQELEKIDALKNKLATNLRTVQEKLAA